MERGQIVTVRPTEPVDTLQRLPAFVGISGATAGATGIGMNLVIVPPGASADAHFHDGYETAIYPLSGRVETRYGDNLRHTCVNEPGDFLFIPGGAPTSPAISATPNRRAPSWPATPPASRSPSSPTSRSRWRPPTVRSC
jgi:uncharacterized RmlC-like cupin family protein